MSIRVGDPYNLVIKAGRSFSVVFEAQNDDGTAVDLTGYTATAELRKYAGGALLGTFTVSVNGPAGEVKLSMTASQTQALTSGGVYDVKLIDPSGQAIDFIEGKVVLKAEVTA